MHNMRPLFFINMSGHTARCLKMRDSLHFMFCVVLWTAVFGIVDGYRPVVIVHGLFDGPKQFINLTNFINKTHPGTSVTTIDLYDDMASLTPIWLQVSGFSKQIKSIMENAKDGIHLICFSQGGLVCRGIIATLPKHNVHSLFFLSSPLSGQYGGPIFPDCINDCVYKLCYNVLGQQISVCNYWNDPHQREEYLSNNKYLPQINGEIYHSKLPGTDNGILCLGEWREHFLGIKKLVLIGGPDDGVITPWQSSQFGFYDSSETVVEMKHQDWYVRDVFGLKTLDSRGDVHQCVVSDVKHVFWHSNFTVYKSCIEKWLT